MTFQQLQYILDIRKTGSFSKTAKNFYVSQASISQAVNALEQELGVEIFQRNWNGVVPTRQGAVVLEEAASICDHHRRLLEGRTPAVRHVRISYAPFAPLTDAFVRLYEECGQDESVRLSQRVIETPRMAELLLQREVDVCVAVILEPYIPSVSRKLKELGLEGQVFASLPTAIIVSPAHPLYHKPELSVRDFERETIIDRGLVADEDTIKTVLDVDRSRAILVDDFALRKELMERGHGYVISYYAGDQGKNRCIPLNMNYVLLVITNPKQPMQPEVSRYLELAQEEVARGVEQARASENF